MSTDLFSVVADPTRRRILAAVSEQARPVNDVVAQLGLSQPAVSKHLKVLREAGLVSMRAQGQRRLYRLEAAPLAQLTDWVQQLQAAAEADAVDSTADLGKSARSTRHPDVASSPVSAPHASPSQAFGPAESGTAEPAVVEPAAADPVPPKAAASRPAVPEEHRQTGFLANLLGRKRGR